ncbi:MAG: alpha amylase C-terminal domain-containing protein, partial [Oscillospiraceae bacterium]|nr:alpha amylase C-terminal domain-containing protein [Oscillospiraceae bacterium]
GDLRLHEDKVIVFYRKGLLFAFNFHHSDSYEGVRVPVPNKADYTVALSSDDEKYGGWGNIEHITYPVKEIDGRNVVELYLPARTAVVLVEGEIKAEKPKRTRKTKAEKEAEAAAATEEKPKRKRTTKKAAETAETAEPAAEKPKRTRKTKKAEETAE